MKSSKSASPFREKAKKTFFLLLKLGIAAGIVAMLVGRNYDEVIRGFQTFDYRWLLPAALLYFSHMVICAYRWYRLTRVLHIELGFAEALSLTMQAYFFSLVVPGGAIGGDLVKIGVLSSRTRKGAKVEGAFTILMDRIVGMIALFVTAIAVTIPVIPVLMKISIPGITLTPHFKALAICGLFGLCLSGLAASGAIFFHRQFRKLPWMDPLMNFADRFSHGMVTRMTDAADLYRQKWQVPFWAALWSIPFVHLMTVAVFGCLAAGLSIDSASAITIIASVTIGNIVGLLPIFPSGVGGRDVATVTLLVAGGMAVGEAKTAQLLYTALVIAFNLFGGLFFIIDPGRKRTREELREAEETDSTSAGEINRE